MPKKSASSSATRLGQEQGQCRDFSAQLKKPTAHLKVVVNGMEMEVPGATNISGLLEILEEPYTPDMIIEINHRFIHAQAYDKTFLKAGDRMEIIHLAMGG